MPVDYSLFLAALTAVGCASLPIGRWGGWRSAAGRRAVRRFELSPMTQLSVQLGGKALWRGIFLNAVLVGSSVYAERFSREPQPARATVVLGNENGEESSVTATGDGPVAAAFQALEEITGIDAVLKSFELHSASIGEDAQGEVTVTVEHEGRDYRGNGTSVDIVEAGSRAYLEVINRILRRRARPSNDIESTASMERATI